MSRLNFHKPTARDLKNETHRQSQRLCINNSSYSTKMTLDSLAALVTAETTRKSGSDSQDSILEKYSNLEALRLRFLVKYRCTCVTPCFDSD